MPLGLPKCLWADNLGGELQVKDVEIRGAKRDKRPADNPEINNIIV